MQCIRKRFVVAALGAAMFMPTNLFGQSAANNWVHIERIDVPHEVTVREYADLVQQSIPPESDEINIILTEGVDEIMVGPLHLRGVTPLGAVKVLAEISPDVLIGEPDVDSHWPTVVLRPRDRRVETTEPPEYMALSLNVSELLLTSEEDAAGYLTPDDLISAIETSVKFHFDVRRLRRHSSQPGTAEFAQPVFKLHPETGLLFIAAPEEDILFYEDVIHNLRTDEAVVTDAELEAEKLNLQRAVEARDKVIEQLRGRMRLLQDELRELRQTLEDE